MKLWPVIHNHQLSTICCSSAHWGVGPSMSLLDVAAASVLHDVSAQKPH